MPLPALREKLSLLPRSRKILLFGSIICLILIITILAEAVFFFYRGYGKKPPNTVQIQGWYQGQRLDMVVGKVIKKEGSIFTIEREGEATQIEIVGKVFYCGSRETKGVREFTSMEASEIQEGMYLIVNKANERAKDPIYRSSMGNEMFIRVYDD